MAEGECVRVGVRMMGVQSLIQPALVMPWGRLRVMAPTCMSMRAVFSWHCTLPPALYPGP